MLRKELLESFHKLEEKVHVLGGCLASTFVLTWAIQHELNEQHAKQVAEFLEVLHKILLGLDVAISILLVLGLTFRAVGIRKPNIILARIAKDKELNERIQLWFTENGVDPKEPNVRFCREDCIDELTRLNYTAFENTQFAIEVEKLKERNREWSRRNGRVFMLIEDPLQKDGSVVGYSAMLPLTAEGIKSYLNGALKDADIPPSLVATDRQSTAAVLLFAIHLLPAYSFSERTPSKNYTAYFLERVRYHIQALFTDLPAPDTTFPSLYVQTELPSLEKRLRSYGFTNTKHRSADGYNIFVLKHPFRTAGTTPNAKEAVLTRS